MWQRLTQVNHSTLFLTSRSGDIIIYIFPSFAAKANANAILYIFHFQTLHTAFLGAHLWQRLTQVNHSTILLLLEAEIIIIYIFPSFAAEANANAILYVLIEQ